MWNWCLIIQQVFSDLTICIAIKSDECDQNKKINFWITAAYIPRKENLTQKDIPLFAILGKVLQKVMP